jgi:hypothetical protein
MVLADKAHFSSRAIRQPLRRRGIRAVIPSWRTSGATGCVGAAALGPGERRSELLLVRDSPGPGTSGYPNWLSQPSW